MHVVSWVLDTHGNKIERLGERTEDGVRTTDQLRVTLSGRSTRTQAEVADWYWRHVADWQPEHV